MLRTHGIDLVITIIDAALLGSPRCAKGLGKPPRALALWIASRPSRCVLFAPSTERVQHCAHVYRWKRDDKDVEEVDPDVPLEDEVEHGGKGGVDACHEGGADAKPDHAVHEAPRTLAEPGLLPP